MCLAAQVGEMMDWREQGHPRDWLAERFLMGPFSSGDVSRQAAVPGRSGSTKVV